MLEFLYKSKSISHRNAVNSQSLNSTVIMKTIIALCIIGLTAVSGMYMTDKVKYADSDFLAKQKVFFDLFSNVWQDEIHNNYFDISKTYKFVDYKDSFTKLEYYTEFMKWFEYGFLPMNEIYAPYQTEQREQMLSVFNMLYHAKDWDTYYNFMVWARYNINPGMFIQAVTMSVLHRDDFQKLGFVLPPIYEITPYYFFNSYVIQNVQKKKMQGLKALTKEGDVYTYTVFTNYTNDYVETNHDSKISYFMEDIGLNAYYYYFNLDYYQYFGGEEFGLYKDRRGEFFYYQIQQLLARYYLERLSNGLDEIPEFNYWEQIPTGYYSGMTFFNGVNFPSRSNYYMMYLNKDNQKYLDQLYSWEHRIFEAIDAGYFLLPNGEHKKLDKYEDIEYLGNLIQNNKDTLGNFYYYGMIEMLAKRLLGGSVQSFDNYYQIPSVLELFETSLRDPVFYMFYKKVFTFFEAFQTKLPKWEKSELYYDGVKIENVEITQLKTYFDWFTADVTNAVDVDFETKENIREKYYYKVKVPRLNHVPFDVKVKVTSPKEQKSIITMFIGPKYDSFGNVLNINDNKQNFWELDRWVVELKSGETLITRKSSEFSWFVKDRTTYYDLYKSLMTAINGGEKFPLDMSEAHCGFPSRYDV